MISNSSRAWKVSFWRNSFSRTLIDPKSVQEIDSGVAAAISLQCENDRMHFEATIARMMRDAATPALGKNTSR